jgi:hypothetical protein
LAFVRYLDLGTAVLPSVDILLQALECWGMLNFYAAEFVTLCQSLQAIRMVILADVPDEESLSPQTSAGLPAHIRSAVTASQNKLNAVRQKKRAAIVDALRSGLEAANMELERLGLRFSLAEVKRVQGHFMEQGRVPSAEDIERICTRITDELGESRFLQISKEHVKYYESGDSPHFGTQVADKFASTGVFEIDEAAKCMALDRPTACVFHLMRVLEIAIAAVRRSLAIPDPIKQGDRNWGKILKYINDEIIRRNGTAPPAWSGADDRAVFSELYVSLDAVRNVWRNSTMHVGNKYTPEEAEHIWNATRGLMMKLASRLDENGQPVA